MKKVTPKQIERLYEFTRQHYVEYYDVQTELVDHLANAIETHWQEFPDDDFETALQKEFRKFGVFGFMDVVEHKIREMNKRYSKILWQKIKDFFTFPKIMMTLCIALVVYTVLYFFKDIAAEIVGSMTLIILFFIYAFLLSKPKLYQNKTDKKWLFENVLLGYNNYVGALGLLAQLHFFIRYLGENIAFMAVFSILITFLGISVYLVFYYLPKNRDKYLMELYPEYKDFMITT
ncbi:hypothetical protein CAPN008_08810 [Capnocytophaga canis]|uniref:hypothetical protein n=1 Tax=Capnocytophaga canis TaxID=1848903 RepID=UPI001ACB66EB|nr:hypothetical protein [Capnocytophaga canis]GIM60831.1 hypothetical protein CAPN008_08810 [Capnocytophaga canis]